MSAQAGFGIDNATIFSAMQQEATPTLAEVLLLALARCPSGVVIPQRREVNHHKARDRYPLYRRSSARFGNFHFG